MNEWKKGRKERKRGRKEERKKERKRQRERGGGGKRQKWGKKANAKEGSKE